MEYERKWFRNTNNKFTELRAKYRVYCKCGHSIVIFPTSRKQKQICDWCGHLVYADKKLEFKDKLTKLLG